MHLSRPLPAHPRLGVVGQRGEIFQSRSFLLLIFRRTLTLNTSQNFELEVVRYIYVERRNCFLNTTHFSPSSRLPHLLNLICFVGNCHSAMCFKQEIRNTGRVFLLSNKFETTFPTSNRVSSHDKLSVRNGSHFQFALQSLQSQVNVNVFKY